MGISKAVSHVGGDLTVAAELAALKLESTALKLKVTALSQQLKRTKAQVVEARGDLRIKDDLVSALRHSIRYGTYKVIKRGGLHYEAVDGKQSGSPYCPNCEGNGLLVKLADDAMSGRRCSVCGANFAH
jgi:hypothetical protein